MLMETQIYLLFLIYFVNFKKKEHAVIVKDASSTNIQETFSLK